MSAARHPQSEGVSNTAELQTVNFAKILDKDEAEIRRLTSACENYGFFYLDLTDRACSRVIDDLHQLKQIMTSWFSQPTEKKIRETETLSNAHGFKPMGVQAGVVDSHRDGFEVLKIAREELRGRRALPRVVHNNIHLFDDFTATSHFILSTILDSLSNGLGLRGTDRFSTYHRDDQPSKSTLHLLHYPATESRQASEIGQNIHTDIGTLTLLFAPQWGLQVMSPFTGQWAWVEPRPGHAIINVADTLRFLSKQRFQSALHKVTPIEGQGVRYSVAYFLRAADTTEFQDSNGQRTNASDWYSKKYEIFEMTHELQKKDTVLTGGMAQELAKLVVAQAAT